MTDDRCLLRAQEGLCVCRMLVSWALADMQLRFELSGFLLMSPFRNTYEIFLCPHEYT